MLLRFPSPALPIGSRASTHMTPASRSAPPKNLHAAYVHVPADALTSLLATIALLAARFYGWKWIDPAVGMIGAVVIASLVGRAHPLVRHDAARYGA
jgi:Co/Zn/Cd efflux system component